MVITPFYRHAMKISTKGFELYATNFYRQWVLSSTALCN